MGSLGKGHIGHMRQLGVAFFGHDARVMCELPQRVRDIYRGLMLWEKGGCDEEFARKVRINSYLLSLTSPSTPTRTYLLILPVLPSASTRTSSQAVWEALRPTRARDYLPSAAESPWGAPGAASLRPSHCTLPPATGVLEPTWATHGENCHTGLFAALFTVSHSIRPVF